MELKADVAVIGSGVAGALCAWTLAQRGMKVVIVEAGPRIERAAIVQAFTQSHDFDFSSGFPNPAWAPRPDWNSFTPGIELSGPEKTMPEYLRVVGGTTWHWNAAAIRMLSADFRTRTTYGVGVDWPITYDTLEPFYTQAETEMGVAGDAKEDTTPRSAPFPLPPLPKTYAEKAIAKAAAEEGMPLLSRPVARNSKPYQERSACQGFGTCSPICPSGAQYSAMVHVERAEKAGARLLENTRIDALTCDDTGRIVSASGKRSDNTPFTIRATTFVLAAGGMENPRLLLMSRLANRSGQVGRNFFEHPGIYAQLLLKEPVYPGRGPQNSAVSYAFRDGALRRSQAAWLMSLNNVVRLHEITNELLMQGVTPPTLDAAIRHRATHQLELESQMEQLPDSENGITLNWNKRDSAGQPSMRLHYSFSDYERAGFEHIRTTFSRLAQRMDAKLLRISEPFGHHHPMGMTRMGANANTSVVDASCRAHDHRNLYILGASVLPSGGTANPTLTIAALALRAAATILNHTKTGGLTGPDPKLEISPLKFDAVTM